MRNIVDPNLTLILIVRYLKPNCQSLCSSSSRAGKGGALGPRGGLAGGMRIINEKTRRAFVAGRAGVSGRGVELALRPLSSPVEKQVGGTKLIVYDERGNVKRQPK